MSEIRKGKIVGFQGSWGSGLGSLVVKDSRTGSIDHVSCENAPTVRALDGAFGNVITEGHMVNNEAIKGKEIYYSVGSYGVLEGFTPVGEASPELEQMYKRQFRTAKKKLKKVM